jgi:hypothetical protein
MWSGCGGRGLSLQYSKAGWKGTITRLLKIKIKRDYIMLKKGRKTR